MKKITYIIKNVGLYWIKIFKRENTPEFRSWKLTERKFFFLNLCSIFINQSLYEHFLMVQRRERERIIDPMTGKDYQDAGVSCQGLYFTTFQLTENYLITRLYVLYNMLYWTKF